MQASLIALVLALSTVAGTASASPRPRTAAVDDEDDEDDEADDDDDEAGDDDDEAAFDDEEEDEDQPPVTAGGLYTIETYPQTESQRPLSMTKDIVEYRLGLGVDATNANAFRAVGALADVRYGLQDNIELSAGFWGIKNFSTWQADVAFEGSIIYELVDLRAGARLARTPDTERIVKNAPKLVEGALKASLPIGFPFRYSPRPQVAVTALETAFAIDFDSPPDATPSVAIVIQPAPVVALLVHAGVVIADFDFSADNLVVPITAAVQLTPSNRLDAGLEFRFGNHNLPAGTDLDEDGKADAFYDDRFAFFYARYRR